MDRAVIAYIHPGEVRAEFMRSMLNTVVANRDLVEAVISLQSGPLLASARNDVVSMFLGDHKADWLWMVDTDMVFADDALPRLIRSADAAERPIMGGLCYAQGENDEPWPTMYELSKDSIGQIGFARYTTWPEGEVVEVGGTGAACLLVHRSVFEKIASGWGEKVDRVFPWFRESSIGGKRRLGEDLTFCMRAKANGIPIHVDTAVQVGHMKSFMLGKVA